MKIRSFNHALDLIARTMLPWEVTAGGRVRLNLSYASADYYSLRYCPLGGVAQCANPDAPCVSGTDPDAALSWAGYTMSADLMGRIINAADNHGSPHDKPYDRALLLLACGLA